MDSLDPRLYDKIPAVQAAHDPYLKLLFFWGAVQCLSDAVAVLQASVLQQTTPPPPEDGS